MDAAAWEVRLTSIAFMVGWVALVPSLLVAGERWRRARRWRERLLAQWRPALVIALLFMSAFVVRGQFVNPAVLAVFCQALVGLAIARTIPGFEPLPVVRAIVRRDRLWRSVGLMLGLAVLLDPCRGSSGDWA